MKTRFSVFLMALGLLALPVSPSIAGDLLNKIGNTAREAGTGIKQGLGEVGGKIGDGARRVGSEVKEDLCKVGNVVRDDAHDKQCEPEPAAQVGNAEVTKTPVPAPKPAEDAAKPDSSG